MGLNKIPVFICQGSYENVQHILIFLLFVHCLFVILFNKKFELEPIIFLQLVNIDRIRIHVEGNVAPFIFN